MNLLAPYFLYLKIAAAIAIIGSLGWYHHHVDQGGYNRRGAEQIVIDATNKAKAEADLAKINRHVKEVQDELDKLTGSLSTKQVELDHAKQISSDYQVRLASGADRLRVRTTSACANQTQHAVSANTASVDNGTEATAELDGTVAAGLVKLAGEGDQAITRLNVCIASYNAVKAAADALK